MEYVGYVHFFVNSESCFFVESFKLASFSFHGAEMRGIPRGSCGEGNRLCFDWSNRVEDIVETFIAVGNKFIRGGMMVRGQDTYYNILHAGTFEEDSPETTKWSLTWSSSAVQLEGVRPEQQIKSRV